MVLELPKPANFFEENGYKEDLPKDELLEEEKFFVEGEQLSDFVEKSNNIIDSVSDEIDNQRLTDPSLIEDYNNLAEYIRTINEGGNLANLPFEKDQYLAMANRLESYMGMKHETYEQQEINNLISQAENLIDPENPALVHQLARARIEALREMENLSVLTPELISRRDYIIKSLQHFVEDYSGQQADQEDKTVVEEPESIKRKINTPPTSMLGVFEGVQDDELDSEMDNLFDNLTQETSNVESSQEMVTAQLDEVIEVAQEITGQETQDLENDLKFNTEEESWFSEGEQIEDYVIKAREVIDIASQWMGWDVMDEQLEQDYEKVTEYVRMVDEGENLSQYNFEELQLSLERLAKATGKEYKAPEKPKQKQEYTISKALDFEYGKEGEKITTGQAMQRDFEQGIIPVDLNAILQNTTDIRDFESRLAGVPKGKINNDIASDIRQRYNNIIRKIGYYPTVEINEENYPLAARVRYEQIQGVSSMLIRERGLNEHESMFLINNVLDLEMEYAAAQQKVDKGEKDSVFPFQIEYKYYDQDHWESKIITVDQEMYEAVKGIDIIEKIDQDELTMYTSRLEGFGYSADEIRGLIDKFIAIKHKEELAKSQLPDFDRPDEWINHVYPFDITVEVPVEEGSDVFENRTVEVIYEAVRILEQYRSEFDDLTVDNTTMMDSEREYRVRDFAGPITESSEYINDRVDNLERDSHLLSEINRIKPIIESIGTQPSNQLLDQVRAAEGLLDGSYNEQDQTVENLNRARAFVEDIIQQLETIHSQQDQQTIVEPERSYEPAPEPKPENPPAYNLKESVPSPSSKEELISQKTLTLFGNQDMFDRMVEGMSSEEKQEFLNNVEALDDVITYQPSSSEEKSLKFVDENGEEWFYNGILQPVMDKDGNKMVSFDMYHIIPAKKLGIIPLGLPNGDFDTRVMLRNNHFDPEMQKIIQGFASDARARMDSRKKYQKNAA